MRRFFYREIVPPNVEQRNYLLKKLAFLKKHVKPAKGTQNLIKMIRRQLRVTDGKTLYYRNNKGLKIYVGDENTRKKNFLLAKDARFLEPSVKQYRSKISDLRIAHKEKYIDDLDMNIRYQTVGGVMMKSDMLTNEMKRIKRKKVSVAKYPSSDDPYIGIELEYASTLDLNEVSEKIVEHRLHNDVRVVTDGSIKVNEIYKHKIEFCILTKWSGLKEMLERLRPIIFDKPQHFLVNPSCGLHVHLDVRNANYKRVYKNLTSMQSVLFSLAAEHRRKNKYCVPVNTTDFDEVDEEEDDAHYHAISKYSFFKHNTIEVRIHQSTLSLPAIEKWITLLKRIADYAPGDLKLGSFDSELKLLKEKVKIEPELIKYIEEREVS